MPPTNNHPCTLAAESALAETHSLFPRAALALPAGPADTQGARATAATPTGLGPRSSCIRLPSVCASKCSGVSIFLERETKSSSCCLLSFDTREFCSVKKGYLQNGHLHKELSWICGGLLTHPSAQLPLWSKVRASPTEGWGGEHSASFC